MTGELDRTGAMGTVLVSSEHQETVSMVSRLVQMLQVGLQEVGNSALSSQGYEKINLSGRHFLTWIFSSVEESEEGTEHCHVHPRCGKSDYQLCGQ